MKAYHEKYYARRNNKFESIKGYDQVRAKYSQNNVRGKVHDRKQDIEGSHRYACLCCSLFFLAADHIKHVNLFTSDQLDEILLRGEFYWAISSNFTFFFPFLALAFDKITRTLTSIPEGDLMEITQLACHDGNLMFDRKILTFKILDRGYGKAAELQEFLERSNDQRILFVHNNRWLGAVKRDEHFFVFNCHPTNCNGSQSMDPESESPAVIFRLKSVEDACEVLKMFGCTSDSPNGLFNVYAIQFQNQ